MLDYEIKTDIVEITLESGKKVKVAKKWVENSMKALETDIEDVLLMWLEDNDYLENEEQNELDSKAKKIVKNVVKSSTEKKTTTRTRKPNDTKRDIINILHSAIAENLDPQASVENVEKIIVFHLLGQEYKVNLTQTRQKKQ